MIQRFGVGPRMSQAVIHDGTVYLAGQVATNHAAPLEQQTREVLAKIDALLKQAGTDKSKLLAINVFLASIGDFDRVNAIYDAWVDATNPPVRACIEARLADPDLRVEMTAIAAL